MCDDGNYINGDGCSSTCLIEVPPGCGDGNLNPNGTDGIPGNADDEQCDDGNIFSADGCSSDCKIEICGNGTVDYGEECDDGNLDDGDGCDDSCVFEYCGDGAIQNFT